VKKKLFVLSDVHGHFTAMKKALDEAGFDPHNKEHLFVSLGDLFDRGRENMEVLRYVERLKHKVLLRGNHEDMLEDLLNTGEMTPHHYRNGTLTTLQSFFGRYAGLSPDGSVDFSGKTRTVDRLFEYLEETRLYFETKNYFFVHGWYPRDPYRATPEAWRGARKCRFTEYYDGEAPFPEKNLVCGHMPCFYAYLVDPERREEDDSIFYGNGLIAIDAGTAQTGKVNVLVLEDELVG